MTPARLERATFGLGTPGTGSQAFPIFPYGLGIRGICSNPAGGFSQSFPILPHRHPKYIQSRRGFSVFSPLFCCPAKYGQSGGEKSEVGRAAPPRDLLHPIRLSVRAPTCTHVHTVALMPPHFVTATVTV